MTWCARYALAVIPRIAMDLDGGMLADLRCRRDAMPLATGCLVGPSLDHHLAG